MPYAIELEEAVIGAIMLETKAIPLVCQFLRPEMFYNEQNQLIYTAVEKMFNDGRNIDILTVTEELGRRGELDKVGGPYNITRLSSRVASSAHIETHALIIKDKYLRRELIKGSSKLLAMAEDLTFDTEEVLCTARELLAHIENDAAWEQHIRNMETLMDDTIAMADRRRNTSVNGVTGVPTGLTDLDRLTAGWQKGDLVVIAARPSIGKTMLALFLARMAAKTGVNVLFCSIEMQGEKLGDRCILGESNINAYAWRAGLTNEKEWTEARTVAGELAQLPIMVDDSPSMSMDYIRAEARMLKTKGKCDIVFIDYLQLSDMKPAGKELHNREQDVSIATRKAKMLAKELNCPVILLSQLNRESENRPGKRPQLADLRESGAIEQDADIVLLLYRPAMAGLATEKESGYPTEGLGMLIAAKHRNGETGTVYFEHNKSMTKIGDYVPPEGWMKKQAK